VNKKNHISVKKQAESTQKKQNQQTPFTLKKYMLIGKKKEDANYSFTNKKTVAF
jgi:hypothetical protein